MKHTTHTLSLREGEVVVKFWYTPAEHTNMFCAREDALPPRDEEYEWEMVSTTADFSEEGWCDEDDDKILEQLRQIVIDQEDGMYYNC